MLDGHFSYSGEKLAEHWCLGSDIKYCYIQTLGTRCTQVPASARIQGRDLVPWQGLCA